MEGKSIVFIRYFKQSQQMNYQETTNYLFTSTPMFEKEGATAYKPGLDTMKHMDEHFGHPHTKYKTIHVAGTNGKGSCSHTIAAILQSQGYKVGLFTSPHLVDFRERIRVNGEMVSEKYVVDFVEKNREFFEPLHPSFFELTTMMALQYFAEQQVDFAVIEVGLGGRLDSTNIITPILSVITNISFDHTQFLGNTLAKIAGEKAGIIKPHTPVVIGEWNNETQPVFDNVAKENDSPIIYAQPCNWDVDFELKGNYQAKNKNTIAAAIKTIENIGVKLSESSIKNGFEHVCELTGLRGRWEKLGENPLVICDTGHNLAGWEYLAPQIDAVKSPVKHIVFGMVDDKDIEHVLKLLSTINQENHFIFYWTQPNTHRAIPVEKIQAKAREIGLEGNCYTTVSQAFSAAKKAAKKEDFIFIGGSSYVVADLLSKAF